VAGVLVEDESNTSQEMILIFDALGREVFRAKFEGTPIRITDLHSGYYFAKAGVRS